MRFPRARVVFNHVLTAANIDDIAAYVHWGSTAGAHAINIIPVKDTPALAATSAQASRFAAEQDALRATARERGVELLYHKADALGWAAEVSGHPEMSEYRCVFPKHALYLDLPTGGIFPCDCTVHRKPAARFYLGNLWKDGLTATWRGRPITEMREILASPCDPGCKSKCDWNNRRSNRVLRDVAAQLGPGAI
jgi:MoaA/NifB/PqqE/SkfB family radical SAM enzyme